MNAKMKVTINLDDNIIYAIAKTQADNNAYDWFEDNAGDANALYENAFAEGMKHLLNIINETQQ